MKFEQSQKKKVIFTALIWLIFLPFNITAKNSYRLIINISEGGEKTEIRLNHFKNYLNKNNCTISTIQTVNDYRELTETDIYFSPLKHVFLNKYQQLSKLIVINNEPLSSSIVVRATTGVDSLKTLANMHIAFLSKQSVTGFQLAQQLFKKEGVKIQYDKSVFTQTNIGSMSLLSHKDVFAAVLATPLAAKWTQANDLKTIAVSQEILTGGLFANRNFNQQVLDQCQAAFNALSDQNRQNKQLIKVFPGWVAGFEIL